VAWALWGGTEDLDLFEFFGFFLAGGHAFSPFDNGVPHFLN
jgi:hypothetical protein